MVHVVKADAIPKLCDLLSARYMETVVYALGSIREILDKAEDQILIESIGRIIQECGGKF